MENKDVCLKKAIKDGYVPEDFYSTTNLPTKIRLNGEWIPVEGQRMDALIVVKDGHAVATKLRDVHQGDLVACGQEGIHRFDPTKEHDDSFGFMNNLVSSERRNNLTIQRLAKWLVEEKKQITFVSGPIIVHSGAVEHMEYLMRKGFVKCLLGGNAVAVHDMERAFFDTSLGINKNTGLPEKNGYTHHMRTINRINGCGSIKEAVDQGVLKSGIMYTCIKENIPFVLAGSLRDDGPLPETKMNMIEAQALYSHHLHQADCVIVLGTMLHGIASGNMLPATIPMICVDIHAGTVTKLADRGSGQATPIVTDAGLFMELLHYQIEKLLASSED